MALTIVEAAQLNPGDVVRTAIIEMYVRNSDILRVLPFENIACNALKYNREDMLPGVGFRGVNEGFTESVGVLNPITESLVIAGDNLDVDRFITQTMGANQRSVQEGLKVKALTNRWTLAFIKGASSSDPRELFKSSVSYMSTFPFRTERPLERTASEGNSVSLHSLKCLKEATSFHSTSKQSVLKRLQI